MQGSDSKMCALCCEHYNTTNRKALRLQQCGHSLCEQCFNQGYTIERRHQCARCSQVTYMNVSVPDYTIAALVRSLEVHCSLCTNNVATQYCCQHDFAHCDSCPRERNCNMKDLHSEGFSLRHYLYIRITQYKANLKWQLEKPENSRLNEAIDQSPVRTNQARLDLLQELKQAEMQMKCFTPSCSKAAVRLLEFPGVLLCQDHAQQYPYSTQLRFTQRSHLMEQLRTFVRKKLSTSKVTSFNPEKDHLVKVKKALKDTAELKDLALAIFFMQSLKNEVDLTRATGLVQCPKCDQVFYSAGAPMKILPCQAFHCICNGCYEQMREERTLVCPMDGTVFPLESTVVTNAVFQ